jgi:hypothetical protein
MRNIILLPLLLGLGATPALAEPLSEAENRTVQKQGVICREHRPALESGETHACIFMPGKVGKHDFGTGRARHMYVISELGDRRRCKEVEILGEKPLGEGEDALRQVGAICLR